MKLVAVTLDSHPGWGIVWLTYWYQDDATHEQEIKHYGCDTVDWLEGIHEW